MAKIVFVGAGSFGFTRGLVRDVLTFPTTRDAELCLVDINKERLRFAERMVRKIIAMGGYPATVTATTDRREVLKGADAVLVTILASPPEVFQYDFHIPKKYGVDVTIGDTRGPSGVFRFLRTIPHLEAITRDMEELCPDALLLNYTNPMAMLCHSLHRTTGVETTGLCHSVQGTAGLFEHWLKLPAGSLDYVCAGINHLAWYLKLERNGRNIYPRLRKRIESDPEVYHHTPVRNELFLSLGYYVTESSSHQSEYSWWYRKRPDLIKQYSTGPRGGAMPYASLLKRYQKRKKTWRKALRDWLSEEAPISLERGKEYAAAIIHARLGGELFPFNGNVPNRGIVTNLPEGCCVEVPTVATRSGVKAIQVGDLPMSVLGLTHLTANNHMLAVEGHLSRDPGLVFQAIAHDPLTAANCSLAEARKMTGELFARFRRYLPQFKGKRIRL